MPNNFLLSSSDGEPFWTLRSFLAGAKKDVVIFSPYLRLDALLKLDLPGNINVVVITTLKLQDLWLGSSDIKLFPYALKNSIKVYINNSIHLKAYIKDWTSCVLGSSNLTGRGLGIGEQYNKELNYCSDVLDSETHLYLKKIISDSVLMNEAIYRVALEKLEKLPQKKQFDEIKITELSKDKTYLISSLPMSQSVERLYWLIENSYKSTDQEEVNCALHDTAFYSLQPNLSYDEYFKCLSSNFFKSRFIMELLEFIDIEERYFGHVKEWIQENCEDVPVPSRRDLTGNIQVLYKWISVLSNGRYVVDRPNYSERIRRV